MINENGEGGGGGFSGIFRYQLVCAVSVGYFAAMRAVGFVEMGASAKTKASTKIPQLPSMQLVWSSGVGRQWCMCGGHVMRDWGANFGSFWICWSFEHSNPLAKPQICREGHGQPMHAIPFLNQLLDTDLRKPAIPPVVPPRTVTCLTTAALWPSYKLLFPG